MDKTDNYVVKDIKLAEQGRKEIDIAEDRAKFSAIIAQLGLKQPKNVLLIIKHYI